MNILAYDNDIYNITGTHLQGHVITDYATLVEKFGEPTYDTPSLDEKTNVEWNIEFKIKKENGDIDYVVATIYDWKQREIPTGKHPWNIGGIDRSSVECVEKVLV